MAKNTKKKDENMKLEIKAKIPKKWIPKKITQPSNNNLSGGGTIYGLGFIGALIYYISNATTLWAGVVGVFKAIFWPAYLVFGALRFLGA